MSWVFSDAEVENAQEYVILLAMADNAWDDGTHVFMGQKKMAAKCRCSVRTLQRHLMELEARGVIRRGDQSLVSHIPAGRRPIVWELVMEKPQVSTGDNLTPLTDDTRDAPHTSPVSPHTRHPRRLTHDTGVVQEPSFNHQENQGGRVPADLRAVPSPATPAPSSPRCKKHAALPADADVPPCRACQRERERFEAQRRSEPTEGQKLAAVRAACTRCDGLGWVIDADDLLCVHPGLSYEQLFDRPTG